MYNISEPMFIGKLFPYRYFFNRNGDAMVNHSIFTSNRDIESFKRIMSNIMKNKYNIRY